MHIRRAEAGAGAGARAGAEAGAGSEAVAVAVAVAGAETSWYSGRGRRRRSKKQEGSRGSKRRTNLRVKARLHQVHPYHRQQARDLEHVNFSNGHDKTSFFPLPTCIVCRM